MSANTRKWIYDVLTVLGPVAVFYGLLSGEEVALWLGVLGTLLQSSGTILARKNVTPDVVEPTLVQLKELDVETLEGLANTLGRRSSIRKH